MSSPERAGVVPHATDTGGSSDQRDKPEDAGRTKMQIDYIDEALEESIPANEPAAYMPTTAVGPPGHDRDTARD